jgi:hypothetical protein
MSYPSHSSSPWSVRRVFVVQFKADTCVEAGWIAGRVEHIASRSTAAFTSVEELMAFIHLVLQQQTRDSLTDGE